MSSSTNILVVRPGALGDTILTLPLLASVAEQHPRARITFLGTRSYADLIPPEIRFQAVDSKNWAWLFAEGLSPSPEQDGRFDLAYLILKRPEAVIANLARVGTYSTKSVHSTPTPGLHMVEHLHHGLGLAVPPKVPSLLRLADPRTRDLIWLHPGSGGPTKCAPLELFVTLAHELRSATGWDIVISAGEDDAFLMERDQWKVLTRMHGTTVMENRPLRELCKVLGGARLFVGNDSGISHLAAGLGIPSAVFFAATHPAQWAPWVPPDRLCIFDLRSVPLDRLQLQNLGEELLRLASAT